MAAAKVINDLHYNGKTVKERLAVDGLLDQFIAAEQANDNARMTDLLERVAISRAWATNLVTRILEGPDQSPIHINLDDPRNTGVIRHFERRNELKFPPSMRPFECPRDPYMHLGSHPDIVERLWEGLAAILPQDCRCIVFGTPALVAPKTGIVLAQAYGTQYVLRIPHKSMNEALQAGAKTNMTWAGGHTTDLPHEYGSDWVFGCWSEQEPAWLLAVYDAAEDI